MMHTGAETYNAEAFGAGKNSSQFAMSHSWDDPKVTREIDISANDEQFSPFGDPDEEYRQSRKVNAFLSHAAATPILLLAIAYIYIIPFLPSIISLAILITITLGQLPSFCHGVYAHFQEREGKQQTAYFIVSR